MKRSKVEQVRTLLERNPRMKTAEVMKALGTTKSYTYVLMTKARASYKEQYGESIEERMIRLRDMARRRAMARAAGERLHEGVDSESKKTDSELLFAVTSGKSILAALDTVNHPAHYKVGGIETIDFIEAKQLGYNLGNVVKYITRADHKGNKLEDLRKAQWYLTRAIDSAK
jgi:hypothetical protein